MHTSVNVFVSIVEALMCLLAVLALPTGRATMLDVFAGAQQCSDWTVCLTVNHVSNVNQYYSCCLKCCLASEHQDKYLNSRTVVHQM